jgi:hypothetical protein
MPLSARPITTELTQDLAVRALQAALLRFVGAPLSGYDSFENRLTSELQGERCYAEAGFDDVTTLAELGDYDRFGVGLVLGGRRYRLVIESES